MNNNSKIMNGRFPLAMAVFAVFIVLGAISFSAQFAPAALAAKPYDFGLREGQTIRAASSNDPDVYIVNDFGYKRLFLNPVIFGFYGQLTGGFSKVRSVTPEVRDAFLTSGLFRNCQTNDSKVYGLAVTGEDTGTLHWVDVTGSQAVSQDPNFFKKVFCINSNEFGWYPKGSNYLAINQIPDYNRGGIGGGETPTPTPTPGAISVSLASDNPGATSITRTANSVSYLKINISGNATLNSLKVERRGPGLVSDFANVYLYDGARRLTSGSSPSSSNGSVTFSNLNLPIVGNKTLTIVADMAASGGASGNVNYFTINSASDIVLAGGGTVGGSFPINGSNMTITGATGGIITIDNSGSLFNPNVGQTHVQLAEFRLTANNEGARIGRLQLIQGGSIKPADISNLSLEVNGTKVANSTMTADGYAVFDMSGNPYFIAKGDNRIIKIFGDVNGRKGDTISFYFETSSDILAIGDQYGFGMSVANHLGSPSQAQTLTLQGGVLTFSFAGPTATNISTTTTKTHLLDFDLSSAASIEMRKHTIVLCRSTNGGAVYDNLTAAQTAGGFGDLNNISVIDRDTGVALVGPQDGNVFNSLSSDANACGPNARGLQKTFTDSFTINSGQTMHLAVVADVRTANNTSDSTGVKLSSGNAIKAVLLGYGTQAGSGDLTFMRYAGTNTAVTSSDIVPSGNISGNSMTVQSSTLSVSLAGVASGNHSFVKGTTNIPAVAFNFSASQGSPITITNITLTGYGGSSASALTAGSAGALISAVRLVDGSTGAIIASSPSSNNLSTAGSGKVQFSNLNWPISGGTTKNLIVQVDLSTNSPGANNIFSFDIASVNDITGLDANSNTVNAGNAGANGTTSPVAYVTVADLGGVTASLAPDTPITGAVYWGQQAAPFTKLQLSSTNEGFFIETLRLKASADSATNAANNISRLHVTYTNKAGSMLTSDGFMDNTGTVTFNWSSAGSGQIDTRPYVPKDSSSYLSISADVKSSSDSFRTSGVSFPLNFAGSVSSDFRAVGEGSGNVIAGGASGVTDVAAKPMYVYRAFPKFTYISTPASTLNIGQDLLRFKVDALGSAVDGASVFFDGNTAATAGSLNFTLLGSGESTNSITLDLRRVVDSNGTATDQLVASATLTNVAANTATPVQFVLGTGGTTIDIPAGTSNTFVIRIRAINGFNLTSNTTTGRPADNLQLSLNNDSNNLVYWTDRGGTTRNSTNGSITNVLKDLPMIGQAVSFR